MENLKTLKDLEVDYPFPSVIRDFCNKELRQEAIKWIKEFQKERTDAISEMFDNVDENGIYPTTKFFNRIDNFWIERFNITEEELA